MNQFFIRLALAVLYAVLANKLIQLRFPFGAEETFSIGLTPALHNRQFIFKLDLIFLTRPSKICHLLLKLCQMVWRVTKQFSYRKRFKSSFSRAAILGKEPLLNEAGAIGVFLTIFAVFSLESFADTLVVVFSVEWQTFTFVLTRPTAARCLSKEMHCDHSHAVLY